MQQKLVIDTYYLCFLYSNLKYQVNTTYGVNWIWNVVFNYHKFWWLVALIRTRTAVFIPCWSNFLQFSSFQTPPLLYPQTALLPNRRRQHHGRALWRSALPACVHKGFRWVYLGIIARLCILYIAGLCSVQPLNFQLWSWWNITSKLLACLWGDFL